VVATTVEVSIAGTDRVVALVDSLAHASQDMRPLWDEIVPRFVAMEVTAFAEQGGAGGPWAPLSPGYAAEKAKRHPGKTILRATDDLFHSLTDRLDIDIREQHMLVMGSADPNAPRHQHGTGRMPARRVIDPPPSEVRTWVELVHAHLVTDMQAAAA
jgi:hypothetical protein